MWLETLVTWIILRLLEPVITIYGMNWSKAYTQLVVIDHRIDNPLFSQPQPCTLSQVPRICAGASVHYSPSMRAGATVQRRGGYL